MANDSSLVDLDAHALQRIHGGMIPVPGGGGYAPPAKPKPSPGGSLTTPDGKTLSCPSGSAPEYESTTVTGRVGIWPFSFPVTYHHTSATCQKIQ